LNVWDDGYPSGGNYWSNYTGVDVKSGPNQDQPGSDGIGDSPHVIDANNKDNYPLTKRWSLLTGDIDGDGDVDGVDFGIFAPCYGSLLGQPNYKRECDLDFDGDDDGVDFGMFAPNYGKHLYYSGLVAHWKFDEGTGTIAYDSSGNNNYGTLYGPTWVNGVYGKALKFDGVNDFVAIPDIFSTPPTELTVSAWVNCSSSSSAREEIIHSFRHGEYGIYRPTASVIGFGLLLDNQVPYGYEWNSFAPNTMHQVVGTWKQGDSVKLYVDGVLVGQTAVPNNGMLDSTPINSAAIGDYMRNYLGSKWFFEGIIDDVMVFSRALTANEVAQLYTLPPP
jgi:hypothetical protein